MSTTTQLKPRKVPKEASIPAPTLFAAPDGNSRFRAYQTRAYCETTALSVCRELMKNRSLREICADPRYPSIHTVIKWLADPARADFREHYYYARRIQAELRIDEIFEIADDTSNDWKPTYDKDGEINGLKPDNEAIQRSRVRIDTRKWYASKMIPRIYGDKLDVELDATGDLAELLKQAKNNDSGLPPPIEGDIDE